MVTTSDINKPSVGKAKKKKSKKKSKRKNSHLAEEDRHSEASKRSIERMQRKEEGGEDGNSSDGVGKNDAAATEQGVGARSKVDTSASIGRDNEKERDDAKKEDNKASPEEERRGEENKDEADDDIITKSTFESLGVCGPLCEAAASLKWSHASRIQKEALPPALAGRDVIGLAETGSGKTGAFAIPILQALLEAPQRAVFAVVLAPTRELAFQIHEVVTGLGRGIGASSVCIVGGVDMASQSIALARNPHVVVATPGRLVDHLTNTKGFHLRKLRYLVMDEADRMLSMDFEAELNQILEVVPDSTLGRKTMLFSATMTSKVQKLQRASLSDPVRIEVSTKFQTPSKLLQSYLFIPAKYKDCYLTYLINEHAGQSVLVFGATCNNVQRLALMLRNLGFPAVCLHGQMSQPKRLGALTKFKSGGRDILICTDVASRGLDIPSVDVVINFDLPGHGKDYIHRVGRTARAGRSGKAIAMVTQYDVEVYQRLEVLLGKKLPEYKLDEETVLVLLERVSDAQRLATRELKEQLAASGRRGKGRKKGRQLGAEYADGDEGVEDIVKHELKRGYYAGGSGGRGGGFHNQRGGGGLRKKQKRR